MDCSRRFYKWVRHALQELKWNDVISPFSCLTLGDHIPSAVYATDIRMILILTAVYASLVTQFAQNANQEATGDIHSGRNFNVNSEFTNNSISGGVSDLILWNCREYSMTNFYYKTLYLGLILSYLTVIVIYFVARVFITVFIANAAWTLTYNNKKVHHLELMANGRKMIYQLSRNLQQKMNCAIKRKRSFDEFKTEIEELATDWNVRWKNLVGEHHKDKKFLYNWLTILYIIPRYETLIMLAMVTFALTSYDIHPLGCLFNIDIIYNEMEMSVTLLVSEYVIRYREASVIVIFILMLHWGTVKFVQYLLLPRRWGMLITNCFSMNLQCTGAYIIDCMLNKCSCSCKTAKCCSVNCSLPCGENKLYDDAYDNDCSSL